MKVFVTGASGHVGQWVVRELLKHDYEVRAFDRSPLPKDLRRDNIEMVFADIADPIAVINAAMGCNAIVHVAAYPNAHHVTTPELIRVNMAGTQNVLDAAVALEIPRVILTSSVGALGFSYPTHPCLPDSLPIRVDHPRRPQDLYGLSKLYLEESAAAATRLGGITTIVLRPPYVMDMKSAYTNGWLPRMIGRMPERLNNSFWSYIDVRDSARSFRLAVEADLTGHHIFYAMADDINVDATIAELTQKFLPNLVDDLPHLTGNSFFDLAPTETAIGFRAKYLWRDVLANGFPDE